MIFDIIAANWRGIVGYLYLPTLNSIILRDFKCPADLLSTLSIHTRRALWRLSKSAEIS